MNVWEWVVFQHWQDKEKAGSAGVITVTVMSAVRLPLHDPPLLLARSNLFIMHQLTPFASHWHSQVPKKGWPKGEQERERERERIEINKESTASRNLPACFPIRGFSLFLSAFPLSSFRLSPYPRLRVPFSDNQSSVIDFALYQLRRKGFNYCLPLPPLCKYDCDMSSSRTTKLCPQKTLQRVSTSSITTC